MDRPVERVLAEWRDAERRLAELDRGSADYIQVRDDVDALAHEYRALVDDRQQIADDLATEPGEGLTAEQWWTTG